ncbi:unnamed protein product [Phytomonas sp. Hart1]|nr:unnamed protein product [Phytomonas sp. Hart1]|eukprot:CCW66677.1 unnamed protein product [Phytomonas sp. isolate Hart1]
MRGRADAGVRPRRRGARILGKLGKAQGQKAGDAGGVVRAQRGFVVVVEKPHRGLVLSLVQHHVFSQEGRDGSL